MRKTFEILKSGKDIPKKKYSYRINFNKLANAMTFIQESLQVKPGVVRDVNIVGNIFRNLPVYERGGKSIKSLTEAYNNSFIASERVGKHTFSLLLNLLTKRGESKAGLSTYYINLRYCSRVFSNMMKRLNYFVDDIAQNDSSTLKNDVTSIHDEWKRM